MADDAVTSDAAADAASRPRRPLRTATLALMALTAVVAGLLAWSLRGEASYALAPGDAAVVDDFATAELAPLDGTFVRAEVSLEGKPHTGFSRSLEGLNYRAVLAVDGAGAAQRWVIHPVPPARDGPRFVPPHLVAGRLTRVGELGARYRGLEGQLTRISDGVSEDAWVLVDGQDPTNNGWALGLVALLLAFVAFNLGSIVRILRRVG